MQACTVLWVSHFMPYPPAGGAWQRSYHLLRQAARHHDVVLAALNRPSALARGPALAEAVEHLSAFCRDVVVERNRWDGSRFRRLTCLSLAPFLPWPYDVTWFHSRELDLRLRQLAASHRFDLIHLDTLGLIPYARHFPSTPLVLNHHNVESHLVHRRAEREKRMLRRLYLRRDGVKLERLERSACRRVAINLTVSEEDARRLHQVAGPVATAVVENGVDVTYFAPPATDQSQRWHLVFAATLSWYPNREAAHYLVREIWPLLAARRAEARITIVGRDPPPELLAAARRDARISVTGPVDDVRGYLAAASTYVCPIQDGGGTRLKVLDALAAGKPLVATGLAVEGLGLTDGRHYLGAETPEQFVRAIERLESEPTLRAQLTVEGRSIMVRRFAWDTVGRRLEHAYHAAIETGRSSRREAIGAGRMA